MFTGIIDHCGTIKQLTQSENALRLVIECQFNDVVEGESIAVDGICLTAVEPRLGQFSCDISPETLRLTTAGRFKIGTTINLERALRLGDRLGGHFVMGHVDGLANIVFKKHHQDFTELTVGGLDKAAMAYIVKKGSIAVNGVSLTINEVLADGFQLMLIPHTLERTNLKYLSPGDPINLEFDWLIRVIINRLQELPVIKP